MYRHLVVLFLCACPVLAEPTVLTIRKSGEELAVQVLRTRIVPTVEKRTVVVNGKEQVIETTVNRGVAVTESIPLNAKAGTYYDIDGQAIDASKLANHLKEGAMLALVLDGQVPTAEQRKKLAERKVTTILVQQPPKKAAEPPPMKPMPPVAPPKQVPPQPPLAVVPATLDVAKDTLNVKRQTVFFEQVQVREKSRNFDGKEVEVTVVKSVPVTKEETVTYRASTLTYQTVEGKKLKLDELPALLKANGKIILAPVEAPPTEEQLKGIKDVAFVALYLDKRTPPKEKEPAPAPPEAEQPFATDVTVMGEHFSFIVGVTKLVPVTTSQVVVQPDGTQKVVQVVRQIPVQELVTQTVTLADVEYQTLAGKAIDPKDVPELLKKNNKVVLSPNGKPVSAEFLAKHPKASMVILMRLPKK